MTYFLLQKQKYLTTKHEVILTDYTTKNLKTTNIL